VEEGSGAPPSRRDFPSAKPEKHTRQGTSALKPKRQDVSQWIAYAWSQCTPQSIVNTWRRIGIGAQSFERTEADWSAISGDEEDLFLGAMSALLNSGASFDQAVEEAVYREMDVGVEVLLSEEIND
jgi:hypothetical protein